MLLRKTRGKLCNFIVTFEGRPARSMHGHYVLAVLPKVFRRSLIFQNVVIAVEMERERPQTALVLCPLRSIINDQISEARNMGFPASSVADLSLRELRSVNFQLLFVSAEKVPEERLLNFEKDDCSSIHESLAAVVIYSR